MEDLGEASNGGAELWPELGFAGSQGKRKRGRERREKE
jgi:hypothetical protein